MAISPIFNHNKTQMVLANETTMGTAMTLLASHNNIKWVPDSISVQIDMESFEQFFASGRHSQGQGTMGKGKIMIKARAPLMLGASVAVPPNLGKALKACGARETIVAATSVAYTPDATMDEGDGINATIGVIYVPTSGSALLVTGKGCMGNFKLAMDAGGAPFAIDFEFTGAFVGVTDGSALALTSPDTGYAPGTIGTSLTIASIPMQVAKLALDAGNTIEIDEDNADATGYGAAYIASRRPVLTLDPKARLQGVDPNWTRIAANTESVFSMTTAIANAMKYTVSAPKIQQQKAPTFGKRGSMLTYDSTYNCHENAGNDEWKILQSA